MLTLPPKRRGRELAACWHLLRCAAGLTRPDGTSARVPWQPSPVETTHPHRTEPPFGERMVAPGRGWANRPWSPFEGTGPDAASAPTGQRCGPGTAPRRSPRPAGRTGTDGRP